MGDGGRPCQICGESVPRSLNSVVCGERCKTTRLAILDMGRKFFPCNGCENCWGDLHGRCSARCVGEFKASGAFMRDLWALVRTIYPVPAKPQPNPTTGAAE